MRTEAQINASRLNGAKSHGPVTAEGKAISSRNAVKHGMLATFVVIDGENRDSFIEICEDLYAEFEPATPFEESLIRTMAVARWKQERIWNVERVNFNTQMKRDREMDPALTACAELQNATAFKRLGDDSRSLDLILRYENRHERQYLRAHKRFLEVRNQRLKSTPPEPEPAPEPVNVIPIDRNPGAPAILSPVPLSIPPNEPKPDPMHVHSCHSVRQEKPGCSCEMKGTHHVNYPFNM